MNQIERDLFQYFWDTTRNDADMQAIFGDAPVGETEKVRMRYRTALPEDKLPYIIHRIDFDTQEPWGVWQGTWTSDLWDYGPNADRIIAMRERMIVLWDHRNYEQPAGVGWKGLRIWLQSDVDLSNQDENRYWHKNLVFGIRLIAAAHIQAILDNRNMGGSIS